MQSKTESIFTGNTTHTYAEGPPRHVPGFSSLHRMAEMLLAERMPENGCVLVLGAGGGLELKAFADAHKDWSFVGVDPSIDMLRLAEIATDEHRSRVRLHHGSIEVAPAVHFDAAVCLLTFHFIPHEQRLVTLKQIHSRLKYGAPFVIAHISFPQTEPERSLWIARHVAYGASGNQDSEKTKASENAIREKLTILAPEEEEAMLREAGFTNVSLFYAGLSFKGWVAYA